MKIGRIINNMQEKLRINKLVQHDKKLNSLVTIHDNGFNRANMRDIYDAQEVLANYAEQKGIHVDVFDKLPEAEALKHEGDTITDHDIFLKVTDDITGKEKATSVQTPKYFEKPFLRVLYESLDNLTKAFRNQH